MQEIKKIGIIGAGNVATNLAVRFSNTGHTSLQVFSRNQTPLNTLIASCAIQIITDIRGFDKTLDVVIIATSDHSIEQVAKQVNPSLPLVHTSGSVST